jgi:hypothetical protein
MLYSVLVFFWWTLSDRIDNFRLSLDGVQLKQHAVLLMNLFRFLLSRSTPKRCDALQPFLSDILLVWILLPFADVARTASAAHPRITLWDNERPEGIVALATHDVHSQLLVPLHAHLEAKNEKAVLDLLLSPTIRLPWCPSVFNTLFPLRLQKTPVAHWTQTAPTGFARAERKDGDHCQLHESIATLGISLACGLQLGQRDEIVKSVQRDWTSRSLPLVYLHDHPLHTDLFLPGFVHLPEEVLNPVIVDLIEQSSCNIQVDLDKCPLFRSVKPAVVVAAVPSSPQEFNNNSPVYVAASPAYSNPMSPEHPSSSSSSSWQMDPETFEPYHTEPELYNPENPSLTGGPQPRTPPRGVPVGLMEKVSELANKYSRRPPPPPPLPPPHPRSLVNHRQYPYLLQSPVSIPKQAPMHRNVSGTQAPYGPHRRSR